MTGPMRGFPKGEYQSRLARAQTLMQEAGLSALLLTTEPEIRYFTGFLTRFWESPTRPWYLVVPASGAPIAVIPAIGAHLMRQGFVTDIRTWQAPDYSDDGTLLLAETLREVTPVDGLVGVPDAMESHVRMPLESLGQLQHLIAPRNITGDQTILRRLRMIKSGAEIDKIERACAIANSVFERVPDIARTGVPLSQVFRQFQILCLEEGADYVPYLAGGAGVDGYGDVISPASDAPLSAGQVLMLDTGLVWDGYFCDFDRNYALGPPSSMVANAHTKLMDAVQSAFEVARPGVQACDLFYAMQPFLDPESAGSDAGRLGHGLGMQLTEWPSLIPADHTELAPGMVLTLEPGIATTDGRMIVHEENIVITQNGARFLSARQSRDIRVI